MVCLPCRNLEQFPRLEEERKRGGVGAGRERTADTDEDDLIRARIRSGFESEHQAQQFEIEYLRCQHTVVVSLTEVFLLFVGC